MWLTGWGSVDPAAAQETSYHQDQHQSAIREKFVHGAEYTGGGAGALMRILWHSCDPELGTGYATQTAEWTRYLRDHGHEVAISSYFGPQGTRDWEGIPVFGPPISAHSSALLPAYAERWKADVVIILADVWLMAAEFIESIGRPVLGWMPIDCDPLSLRDTNLLHKARNLSPVAMARHGQRVLAEAGFEAPCVPHAIDTALYRPEPRRNELRAAYGIAEGDFAIGICANNVEPFRKALDAQMWAFAELARKHPGATLFIHSIIEMKNSLNLPVLARTLRISERVRFSDQIRMETNDYPDAEMARWYAAMDLVSNATCGEGFGLPTLNAQACGTPVVLADNTTGPELRGPGWLVPCEPFWNYSHGAWWHRPSPHGIKKAYEKAIRDRSPFKRDACRLFAETYSIEAIGPQWLAILEGEPCNSSSP